MSSTEKFNKCEYYLELGNIVDENYSFKEFKIFNKITMQILTLSIYSYFHFYNEKKVLRKESSFWLKRSNNNLK